MRWLVLAAAVLAGACSSPDTPSRVAEPVPTATTAVVHFLPSEQASDRRVADLERKVDELTSEVQALQLELNRYGSAGLAPCVRAILRGWGNASAPLCPGV